MQSSKKILVISYKRNTMSINITLRMLLPGLRYSKILMTPTNKISKMYNLPVLKAKMRLKSPKRKLQLKV